jgi:sterol desaturase/sphingolipid hydroxylase (fatty acid hydroxylase superfamily)
MRLSEAARGFTRYRSPQVLLGLLALLAGIRVVRGEWDVSDVYAAVGLVAVYPFLEWFLHVVVLHVRPHGPVTRALDAAIGRSHRAHHADPTDPDILFLLPRIVVGLAVLLLALAVFLPASTATGALVAGLLALGYEWTHYLIHTPYRPKSTLYKAVYRRHRLHHFRNERYWFGVTNGLADRVLGTNPAKDDVPVSPTARTALASR